MAEKKTVRIDDKLGLNKFNVNENEAHIIADKNYPDKEELVRLTKICPAALYKLDDEGNLHFDYLGCLECGTCRVLSGGKAVREWHYPQGTFGVSYRKG